MAQRQSPSVQRKISIDDLFDNFPIIEPPRPLFAKKKPPSRTTVKTAKPVQSTTITNTPIKPQNGHTLPLKEEETEKVEGTKVEEHSVTSPKSSSSIPVLPPISSTPILTRPPITKEKIIASTQQTQLPAIAEETKTKAKSKPKQSQQTKTNPNPPPPPPSENNPFSFFTFGSDKQQSNVDGNSLPQLPPILPTNPGPPPPPSSAGRSSSKSSLQDDDDDDENQLELPLLAELPHLNGLNTKKPELPVLVDLNKKSLPPLDISSIPLPKLTNAAKPELPVLVDLDKISRTNLSPSHTSTLTTPPTIKKKSRLEELQEALSAEKDRLRRLEEAATEAEDRARLKRAQSALKRQAARAEAREKIEISSGFLKHLKERTEALESEVASTKDRKKQQLRSQEKEAKALEKATRKIEENVKESGTRASLAETRALELERSVELARAELDRVRVEFGFGSVDAPDYDEMNRHIAVKTEILRGCWKRVNGHLRRSQACVRKIQENLISISEESEFLDGLASHLEFQ
eukprot:TRINITY_DN12555_c0_g1_i1.p1 TRINITY_DN12555_c0_g1~~TRINITY_DN12555_c0_g1_i1.p1  ORF type:complete len:519 (-),score=162.04 TRINITY_DN12555_c0_g1_i1:222-1778(-)